jgi:protocatechuate 3,4-dioxygenase beta subunit
MNQSNFSNYSVSTDNEGKFFFEGVTPGTYILSAERTGYLRQFYGTKNPSAGAMQMKLDAGQEMKGLVFKLVPQGMIFGKVVDDDGDPLPNFMVQTSRWAFLNGKKQLQTMGNTSSQADGTFVIGSLQTGRYSLSADSRANNFFNGMERSGNSKSQESYLKTYFPNVLDASAAALIDVAAGAEVRGIEIHVRRGRVFEVRGRIESGASAPKYASLMLIPKGGATSFLDQRQAQVQSKDGAFAFKSVPPGAYVLQSQNAQVETRDPTGEFSKSTQLVARLEVTVADQNIENLIVPLSPGPEIKGIFKTEGTDPISEKQAAKAPPSVQFSVADDSQIYRNVGYGEADHDGTFRMQGVSPSVVRVHVYGLPDNSYVKAINFGGQDYNGKNLDLTSGSGGEMEIVLSPNGAEVTGTVRDADGKAVPGAIVQICDKSGELVKTANTDQNAAFDLKGLAPGDYKAFAWEDRGDGVITDPDLRKSFESKATVVKLSEKSRENIEPVLITKDAMEVEAAKIR